MNLEKIIDDTEILKAFLKQMIVETLKLEEVAPQEIDDAAPLFKDGLGLDSIDALELVVAIEKHFDVIIEDESIGQQAFASISALAEFIQGEYNAFSADPLRITG